jgi:hypothetical protein
MSSPHRARLIAVVADLGPTLADSERIEVQGCIEAGEERLALELLAQFLTERDAAVTPHQRDELVVLETLYGTRRGLDELRLC